MFYNISFLFDFILLYQKKHLPLHHEKQTNKVLTNKEKDMKKLFTIIGLAIISLFLFRLFSLLFIELINLFY